MSRARAAASLAAGIAFAGTLTACGGSDRDGTYVRAEEDHLMTLTIDGDQVTHEVTSCGEAVAEEPSIGEITEDGSGIVWTQSDGFFSNDKGTFADRIDIDVSHSAIVMPYTRYGRSMSITFAREGRPQAEAIRAEYAQECS